MADHAVEGEIVDEPQGTGIAVPPPSNGSIAKAQTSEKTPTQAKSDAISLLLGKAIERASTLILTPEESKALKADFPDECFRPGAAGKDNLIYIEGPHLRQRLDDVIGIGQWALVRQSRWTDDAGKGTIVYVDMALIVRGCYVTDAIGDMTYYPGNAMTNFGDAVEGAESAALRRCAKKMGIGLQAWSKTWCEGWWARRRNAAKVYAEQQLHPQQQQTTDIRGPALAKLEAAAAIGRKEMSEVWESLSKAERQACAPDKERLKTKAGEHRADPTTTNVQGSGIPATSTDLKALIDRIEVLASEKGVPIRGAFPDGEPLLPKGKKLNQIDATEAAYIIKQLNAMPRSRQPGED